MKKNIFKSKKIQGEALTVFNFGECSAMLSKEKLKTKETLFLSISNDSLNFYRDTKKVSILDKNKKEEKLSNCYNFSVSSTSKGFILTYVKEERKSKKIIVCISKDAYVWNYKSEVDSFDSLRSTISYNDNLDKYELWRDGLFVKVNVSDSISKWKDSSILLFTSRGGKFDEDPINIIGAFKTEKGTLLFYDSSLHHKNKVLLQMGAVLIDKENNRQILWRGDDPVIQSIIETSNKNTKLVCLGIVIANQKINAYWLLDGSSLVVVSVPIIFRDVLVPHIKTSDILKRCILNPVMRPHPHNEWESEAVFNPAVFSDEEGVIHVLYRAMGGDGISRVGYAQSLDGVSFVKRLDYPVFEPSLGFGLPDRKVHKGPIGYHPAYYTSGGGWAGAEDPRAVKIGDKIYMIYVAFEGWHSVRIAITSISNEDFKKGDWKWKKPILISPPGEVHKNWVLFPEKINGKYAILHGISPDVLVDYVDELDEFDGTKYIKSAPPKGGRDEYWDNKMRGAGPPPLKTSLGWLLFYHAMDKFDPNKYKLGAMILDLEDPTKILHRSPRPILSPDMHYENDGKPGVVYNSGATIKGDDLYIYYGGGDKVICVATTKLHEFLDYLVKEPDQTYSLKKVSEKMI